MAEPRRTATPAAAASPRRTDPDVCIVGAGLAGGLLAWELARQGRQVVVLEAGHHHDPAERGAAMRRVLAGGPPPWAPVAARDVVTTGGPIAYPLNALRVKGVGGSTLHWTALCLRLGVDDFQLRRRHGIAADWPIAYADLEPFYGAAEREMGVAGVADNPFAGPRSTPYPLPPFPYSYADGFAERACSRLGIALHHAPYARNSRPHDGRPACQAFGTCASHHICPVVSQYTTEGHLRAAERTGRVRVLTDASVLRLEVDGTGRVVGAVYRGLERAEGVQRARVFVVAAHAVETARLLLLSSSGTSPRGLANGSGMVGRHFMEHPVTIATGRVREPLHHYRIGFHTAETHQFAAPRNRAETGGFRLSFLNQVGPMPGALARASGRWGAALEAEVREAFGRHVGMHAFVEQLPDPANAVTLDPDVRDAFGQPAPRVTYGLGAYELRTRDRAVRVMTGLLDAMGAADVQVSPPEEFIPCAHQMGTCRMGDDPATSVVDRDLRAHEVDNLFVVGSAVFPVAGPLNPSLTIAALALRAAGAIQEAPGARARPGRTSA
jgi:choline dehydrogenase-like flavoprotein